MAQYGNKRLQKSDRQADIGQKESALSILYHHRYCQLFRFVSKGVVSNELVTQRLSYQTHFPCAA